MTQLGRSGQLSESAEFFRRYTAIPYAIETLRSKALTLRPTDQWEDRNDIACINKHMEGGSFSKSFGLCVTGGTEHFHHWTSYTSRGDLCSILFKRVEIKKLMQAMKKQNRDFHFGKVKYVSLAKAADGSGIIKLPFTKHAAYTSEQEWRAMFFSKDEKREPLGIEFEPGIVERVVLNPWIHVEMENAVRSAVNGIPEFSNLPVSKSKVLENEKWLTNILK